MVLQGMLTMSCSLYTSYLSLASSMSFDHASLCNFGPCMSQLHS